MNKKPAIRLTERYIGIMSGTSMDGVDVALCTINANRCKLVCALEYPFDPQLKEEILLMINSETTLKQVGELNHRLGTLFGKAVNALLEQEKIDSNRVKAIGSHGQTLWHAPSAKHPFSMQLGDASIIATMTGIDVVSDFRSKDIALGGEGAPFAPVFHQFLFHSSDKKRGVLNIGGMANITVLGDELIGFDTGPGNVLMDLWVHKHQELRFDQDGKWAKEGKADKSLLEELLAEPYFKKEVPKSTGRELFNLHWLGKILRSHRIVSSENVQATLLELTVQSIAVEVQKYEIKELMVCGGGVNNAYLMERLAQVLNGVEISTTDEHGVSSEHMEAMIFAWLAYKRMHREPVELKAVTGAKHNGILGGVYAKD
ncbi:MAG: anhydro-N-acetylmuramic acid kinase [Sulfurimonadaceae bacterium]